MVHLIRAAVLSGFGKVAESVGVDPLACLEEAGLEAPLLDHRDRYIPVEAFMRLLEAAARRSGRDDFGLRLAASRRLSDLGMLGLSLKVAPTFRAALDLVGRFIRLHNEAAVLRLEEFEQSMAIGAELDPVAHGPRRQLTDHMIGSLYVGFKDLMGPGWRPREIQFRHRAPASMEVFRRVFDRTPVKFGADRDAIVCDIRDIDRAVPGGDEVLAEYGRRYLESLATASPATFSGDVRRMIAQQMPTGRCTIKHVARRLELDPRTVQRRLEAEGSSYSRLLNDVRREAALRSINLPSQRVADIAAQLGFSEASAMARWFRQQFGCSIGEWRRRSTGREAA